MKTISVGSLNPVKVGAVKDAATKYWTDVEVIGVNVPSGVSQMPMTKQEVRKGARTRAYNALNESNSWLGVGNEGGVCKIDDNWYLFGSTLATDNKIESWGGETLVQLPEIIINKLDEGKLELGLVIDSMTGKKNTKQSFGAIGILTNYAIKRRDIFTNGALMALSPWLNLFEK